MFKFICKTCSLVFEAEKPEPFVKAKCTCGGEGERIIDSDSLSQNIMSTSVSEEKVKKMKDKKSLFEEYSEVKKEFKMGEFKP